MQAYINHGPNSFIEVFRKKYHSGAITLLYLSVRWSILIIPINAFVLNDFTQYMDYVTKTRTVFCSWCTWISCNGFLPVLRYTDTRGKPGNYPRARIDRVYVDTNKATIYNKIVLHVWKKYSLTCLSGLWTEIQIWRIGGVQCLPKYAHLIDLFHTDEILTWTLHTQNLWHRRHQDRRKTTSRSSRARRENLTHGCYRKVYCQHRRTMEVFCQYDVALRQVGYLTSHVLFVHCVI